MKIKTTKLKDWKPSTHDHSPVTFSGASDKGEWHVLPLIKTRDSGVLETSNFESVTAHLEKIGTEFETLRCGHWACGWYEILITPVECIAQKIAEELDGYPIFSEDHYSEAMDTACNESWANLSVRERYNLLKEVAREETSIFAARHNYPPYDDNVKDILEGWSF